MPAQLSQHDAHLHHLLLLDAEISADDVEALARSRYPHAGWLDAETIALDQDVMLTGPWELPAGVAAQIRAPGWATQVVMIICPQERTGPVPPELRGLDAIADAYPYATPGGRELETLQFGRACARRLAGALHLAGTAVTIEPDPDESIDLTVYASTFLRADQARALLPGAVADAEARRSWSLSLPVKAGHVQVIAGVHPIPPIVLSNFEWSQLSLRGYEVRWHPPELLIGRELGPRERELRTEVAATIEQIAGRIATLTEGVAVDDDGFLVDVP